ncbi:MAG: hypothetical protein M5U34_15155 [Chloroflexi bacterium]|nr:hypothetical protein [Chloroflexota bacterium]
MAGVVTPGDSPGFWLPPVSRGYANAQLDDYGRAEGSGDFLWRPGVSLRLQARFSHVNGALRGTAGFGFGMPRLPIPGAPGRRCRRLPGFFMPRRLPICRCG